MINQYDISKLLTILSNKTFANNSNESTSYKFRSSFVRIPHLCIFFSRHSFCRGSYREQVQVFISVDSAWRKKYQHWNTIKRIMFERDSKERVNGGAASCDCVTANYKSILFPRSLNARISSLIRRNIVSRHVTSSLIVIQLTL